MRLFSQDNHNPAAAGDAPIASPFHCSHHLRRGAQRRVKCAMSIRWLWCLLVAGLNLSGCVVPAPSVDERSPAVSGRVIDATTKRPIKGATVALHEHPSYKARTDGAGIYHIRARHNVHLLLVLGICGEEIPSGNYYRADELDVSHPFYQPTRIQAAQYLSQQLTNGGPVVLRD